MEARRLWQPAARRPASGSTGSRSRMRRRWLIPAAAALSMLMVVACARETRHRVLSFFYDGVPPLDGGTSVLDVDLPEEAATADQRPERVEPVQKFYVHPPWKANRCGECHDVGGGRLLKTAREGLCQSCHPDKPAKKKFVHGPVAVNGCLACHLYHKARYPKVLIADPQTLCFHCHEMDAMRTDEHHATIKEERCIDCHDAHGGDDRYFLLPKAAKTES